jgi:L-threonylcarbamoyladenylate synthase
VKLLKSNHDNLVEINNQAKKILSSGGLVIFPTETVYGAGVDATNPQAVEKLLAYKARREGKPLSIAVTDQAMAEKYVELNEQARALYRQFLPGPVTVVSKIKTPVQMSPGDQRLDDQFSSQFGDSPIAPGVASEFGTLGVRIPDHPLIIELVRQLGRPITATSANASDQKRPYSIQDIMDGLSEKQKSLIDLVIDAGTLPPNKPSTVIDTTLSTPVTLRAGSLSEQDERYADRPELILNSSSEQETKSIAARLLLKHWNDVRNHGLVIGLDGALGVGKTIFAKGVAEFLQIEENITSPTYTYIEEYPYTRHQTSGTFYHLDMWKVESEEEFERLEVEQLLGPGNVIVIEWFSQVRVPMQALLDTKPLLDGLKNKRVDRLKIPLLQILVEEIQESVSSNLRQLKILT